MESRIGFVNIYRIKNEEYAIKMFNKYIRKSIIRNLKELDLRRITFKWNENKKLIEIYLKDVDKDMPITDELVYYNVNFLTHGNIEYTREDYGKNKPNKTWITNNKGKVINI